MGPWSFGKFLRLIFFFKNFLVKSLRLICHYCLLRKRKEKVKRFLLISIACDDQNIVTMHGTLMMSMRFPRIIILIEGKGYQSSFIVFDVLLHYLHFFSIKLTLSTNQYIYGQQCRKQSHKSSTLYVITRSTCFLTLKKRKRGGDHSGFSTQVWLQ